MANALKSIGGKFSDLWLDLELYFARSSRKNIQVSDSRLGSIIGKEKPTAEKLPLSLKLIGLGSRDQLEFFDQMATLIGSGVNLIDSLSLLQAQTKNKSHRQLYAEMIHRINGGMTLSDTMSLFTRAFTPMQSSLVEAGERSGNLKTVFVKIAENMEAQMDFSRKIKGAMFYPLVVLCMALVMVTGMVIFVIPKVAKLYEQSNAKLPALTQTVINISNFISTKYPIILGTLALSIFFLWFLITKTRSGRWTFESFVGSLPVFGSLSRQKSILTFASSLGMLLESGVLISDAFEITGKTVESLHYQKALGEIRHGIILGRNVSEMMGLKDIKAQQFEVHPLFPLQVAQMMHIGEQTGSIAKMLDKIRENYHKNIDYTLRNLSTLVEPMMIFFVALIVGSILLAVMLPFFYIGTTVH